MCIKLAISISRKNSLYSNVLCCKVQCTRAGTHSQCQKLCLQIINGSTFQAEFFTLAVKDDPQNTHLYVQFTRIATNELGTLCKNMCANAINTHYVHVHCMDKSIGIAFHYVNQSEHFRFALSHTICTC